MKTMSSGQKAMIFGIPVLGVIILGPAGFVIMAVSGFVVGLLAVASGAIVRSFGKGGGSAAKSSQTNEIVSKS
jgi:hypothetical protein